MADAALERLATSPLFDGLTTRLQQALVGAAATRRLSAGQRLLVRGEINTSLFIVVDGGLDVVLPSIDAPHLRLGPGECVGELSVLDGQPVSADVVAIEPSTILQLDSVQVWSLIDASATFARNLLRVLAARVRHDHTLLAESADDRRRFERLSMVDSLTTLHNRQWLDEMFPLQIARLAREGRRGALMIADVDGFKETNATFGQTVGDATLRRVGRALLTTLRPGDLLARFGGEEFATLIADVDERSAVDVAERLRRQVADSGSEGAPACTVSIGVAVARPNEPFETLLARAADALARAKAQGPDHVSG